MIIKRINIIIILSVFFLHVSCRAKIKHEKLSDLSRIENDLRNITKTDKSRNYLNVETLDYVAAYIYHELEKNCDTVYYQIFKVGNNEYRNVIGLMRAEKKEKIIIGAHYDVAGTQEGADDNASGVTGMLELSRLLKSDTLNYGIEFVAYTLEEPPYFGTDKMGSYIHATSKYNNNEPVYGMICLEMIGYFNDSKKSQNYPLGILKLFYGNIGDFITVVQKTHSGKFGRMVKRIMKKNELIKTKSFKGPPKLPGIDFSDHRNYWRYGYSAVMITNTAFYRNENYHEDTDKIETLDLNRMGLVIDEIYLTIKDLQ